MKKLTEEECLEIGGHCYEYANYVLTSDPPISVRICKHCGKRQHGTPQELYDWYDVGTITSKSENKGGESDCP